MLIHQLMGNRITLIFSEKFLNIGKFIWLTRYIVMGYQNCVQLYISKFFEVTDFLKE